MAGGPSLRDIKKLLDDSAVSDEVKRDLILGYGGQYWDSAADLRPYATRLGMPSIGQFPGQLGLPDGDLDRALDQAQKQIDKRDADNGQQALGESSTGAANSNAILDHGEPGLRYFQYFAPLYRKCISGSDISVEKARQLYDEQRDMIFAALRADGDTLTKSAAKLSEEITTQRNAWNTIDQLWTGQGADAATSYVGSYLGQARTAQSDVDSFAKLLSPSADALEQAVHDKATFVADLYTDTVGGKSPAQIEEIIYYAQHGHNVFSALPEAARIVHMFGMSAGPSGGNVLSIAISPAFAASGAASELLEKAKRCATNFVDNVFVPDVEARWRGLVNVCTATDKSVREIYLPIVAESNSINDHPFAAATATLPPVTAPRQTPPPPHPTGHHPTATASADQPGGSGAGVVPTHSGGGASLAPQPQASAPQLPSPRASFPQALLPQPPLVAPQPGPTTASTPTLSPTYLSGLTGPAAPPSPGTATGPAPGHGVAWLRDPSMLPPGWTIDPSTAELVPPASDTAGASTGDTPVASGSVPAEPPPMTGPGALPVAGSTVPPTETPPSITITDGHSTLTVAAEPAGAQGIDITVTDPAGSVSRYTVEMGDNGLPQLTADPVLPADLTETADAPTLESGPAGSATAVGPVPGGLAPASDFAGPPEDAPAGQPVAADAPADQPVAANAPADEPVQVRAASAVGWSDDRGSTTDASGTSDSAAPTPDGVPYGGSPSAGYAQMSELHGDLPAAPAPGLADQWLLEGAPGDDHTEWSSLASVLAPGQARPSADASVATWADKPAEP